MMTLIKLLLLDDQNFIVFLVVNPTIDKPTNNAQVEINACNDTQLINLCYYEECNLLMLHIYNMK